MSGWRRAIRRTSVEQWQRDLSVSHDRQDRRRAAGAGRSGGDRAARPTRPGAPSPSGWRRAIRRTPRATCGSATCRFREAIAERLAAGETDRRRAGDVRLAQGDLGRFRSLAGGGRSVEHGVAARPRHAERIGNVRLAHPWRREPTRLAAAGGGRSVEQRVAARPVGEPREDRRRAAGAGRSGGGAFAAGWRGAIWRGRSRPTRPGAPSPSGWRRAIRRTPSGSATCRLERDSSPRPPEARRRAQLARRRPTAHTRSSVSRSRSPSDALAAAERRTKPPRLGEGLARAVEEAGRLDAGRAAAAAGGAGRVSGWLGRARNVILVYTAVAAAAAG